jgi:hypothetical protein
MCAFQNPNRLRNDVGCCKSFNLSCVIFPQFEVIDHVSKVVAMKNETFMVAYKVRVCAA